MSLFGTFHRLGVPSAWRVRNLRAQAGYAMAVLIVGIGMMMIMLTVAMPVWHQAMQREKEEELIFRGNQYARAVGLFGRKFANAYPPSVDVLVQQKFLRKKYKDPMVEDGEFQLIPAGARGAGQTGVSLATTSRTAQGGRGTTFTISQGSSTSQTGFAGQTLVAGGLIGVVSKSKDQSIKLYLGKNHYNEWLFVYSAQQGRGRGVPGGGMGRGRGGRGNDSGPGGGIFGPGSGRGRGGFGPGGGMDPQFPPGGGRGRGGFGPGGETP